VTPSVTAMPGVLTLAVIDPYRSGVLKPLGWVTDSVVAPPPAGSNCVEALDAPPAMVTGDVVIVPTVPFELRTGISNDIPPATGIWEM